MARSRWSSGSRRLARQPRVPDSVVDVELCAAPPSGDLASAAAGRLLLDPTNLLSMAESAVLSATSRILATPVQASSFRRSAPRHAGPAPSRGLRGTCMRALEPPWCLVMLWSPHRRLPDGRSARASCALLLAGGLVGCGHPASRDECVEIFERSATIELRSQNVTDPEVVRQRIEDARAARGDSLLGQCVGKRITERAMRCVRRAETTKELEACLM